LPQIMIRPHEDKGGQRRAGHKRNTSAADGLIDIIEFLTLASIPEGQGPVSPTRNSFHEINRLAARFVRSCTLVPSHARMHNNTALTSKCRLFLLTCRQSGEPPQPQPPAAAPAAAPSAPSTEETDNDGSVGKKMHRRNPSGVALSETVTDTVTCATSDESGDIGALGGEFIESDERFVWCGNHVFDAHSGELRWTDRPDHLSLKRGDRVMEIMKFKARAQLRDLTCTVTTYKKTWGAYVPVHTRRTELGTFEEQAADEPPYEFHMPPDDVPNSFVVCGEYKVSIAFDSASTGQKPLLVRHAWSKIS